MKQALATATFAFLLVAVLCAAPAMAQDGNGAGDGISVSVTVGGEEVSDGERLNIEEGENFANVTVESENELNTLSAELHNKTVLMGINGTSHYQSYVIETRPGPNFYTVTASDLAGNTAIFSVNLYREPTTVVELRQTVERLETRKAVIENEIVELEERVEELEQANSDLEESLVSLRGTDGHEGEVASEEDGEEVEETNVEETEQTLPGFTAVAAILAVVVGVFAVYRRRGG